MRINTAPIRIKAPKKMVICGFLAISDSLRKSRGKVERKGSLRDITQAFARVVSSATSSGTSSDGATLAGSPFIGTDGDLPPKRHQVRSERWASLPVVAFGSVVFDFGL